MVFHYYYSFCTQSFTQMLYHTAGWLCCAQIFIVVWHEREGGGKYILEWFGGQVSYGKINSLHLEIIVVICLQHIAVIWQCSRDAEDNKYLHFGTNFIHLDTWLVNDLLIIRCQSIYHQLCPLNKTYFLCKCRCKHEWYHNWWVWPIEFQKLLNVTWRVLFKWVSQRAHYNYKFPPPRRRRHHDCLLKWDDGV